MNKMDMNSFNSLRGKRKSISNNKFAEKLGKLRDGQIELNPGAAQAYKHLYGNQAAQSHAQAGVQNTTSSENDYSLLRQDQPQAQPQMATASSSVLPSPKLGVSVKFKPTGKLYIQKDQEGCNYAYDSFELDKIVFAKTDKVPDKLKKGISAKGYFTVSDVNIDLTDIHHEFEEGKEIVCTVKDIESFFQRSTSDSIAQGFQVEAEINTDLISIPAQFEIKARPVVAELMEWIKAGIVANNQINEIIAMIPEASEQQEPEIKPEDIKSPRVTRPTKKPLETEAETKVETKNPKSQPQSETELQKLVASAPLEKLEEEADEIFSKLITEDMSEEEALGMYQEIEEALTKRQS